MDWEIIVVDNNSIDATEEIINEFPLRKKISYFLIENFGVIGKSRNLGITQAKGKYIAFLDSDDWWHENKLQLAFEYLEIIRLSPNSLLDNDQEMFDDV